MKVSDIPPIVLKEYSASNSLRMLYSPQHSNPLVCLQLYIRSGSVNENDSQRGYAHFLEHLVFKSTPKYPDNQLSLIAAENGAVLNAYTDFDATCYYLVLPSEKLETGMEILSEMVVHPCFSANDVELEKSIIIEEIHQYEAEPEMDFIEFVQTTYFEQSPMRHPVLGTVSSIKKASYVSLRSFYEQHYTPDNAFMVATGDFDEEELKSLFHKYFDGWVKKDAKPKLSTSVLPDHFRTVLRNKNGHALMAFTLPELNESHPDSESLHIAIRHLAIGKSSLLHKSLVEQERLCSSVKVSSLSGLLPGISVILFSPTRADNIPRIIEYFCSAWQDIMQTGVPSDHLSLVQKDIIHNWLYSFDGVENMANLIAAEEFNGDLSRIRGFGSYIESINNENLISAVRDHWQWKRLSLYVQTGKSLISDIHAATDRMDKLSFDLYNRQEVSPLPAFESKDISITGFDSASISAYHNFTLPNSMEVIYHYQAGRDICGFALSSPLSQLNEIKTGLNYFSTALMLYGTKSRNHDQIMRFSREHGFNIRVLHHLDSTIFRGRCHKSDLVHVLSMLSDILYEPVFDAKYLRMLQSAASDSLRRERDYPVSVAYKSWFRQVFGRNNNLFSATGNISDIVSINIEDCETWHERWKPGKSFALCIVGSLPTNEVEELVLQHFSKAGSTHAIPSAALQYQKSPAHIVKRKRNLDQAIIHVGGIACPAQSREENSAFHVLAHILGGELSSRLFSILREELGFAYQTGFDFSSIQELGFWYAHAFCDSNEHKHCMNAMLDILNDVVVNGVTQKELDSAKNYLTAISRMDNESVSFQATGIANLISLGYDLEYYLNRENRINATSLEALHKLAAQYLVPENRQINILV